MPLTEWTTTHTVTVDGVEVTYHDSTREEGGRPLVLVHGTGGTTATHYGHLFPMMATRTRVIGVDWAPLPQGRTLELADLVAQVMGAVDAALGAGAEFDLVGYSLGSVVATQIAAEQKERVKSLVLVAGWMRTDIQQRLRNGVWRRLYDLDPAELARYTVFCAFSPQFLRALPPSMLDAILAGLVPSEFTAAQMDLNARIDLDEEALDGITATTLVVSCTQDMMIPPHHQHELLGAIEDARLTTMSSGHGFFAERPAELMQIVDLFLREPDRHPAGSVIPETHG